MKHVEKQVKFIHQRLQSVCYYIVWNMAILLQNSFASSNTFTAGCAYIFLPNNTNISNCWAFFTQTVFYINIYAIYVAWDYEISVNL